MVFNLMQSASKRWRALTGSTRTPVAIVGVQFADGINQQPGQAAA